MTDLKPGDRVVVISGGVVRKAHCAEQAGVKSGERVLSIVLLDDETQTPAYVGESIAMPLPAFEARLARACERASKVASSRYKEIAGLVSGPATAKELATYLGELDKSAIVAGVAEFWCGATTSPGAGEKEGE